jgi:hypothetical protein
LPAWFALRGRVCVAWGHRSIQPMRSSSGGNCVVNQNSFCWGEMSAASTALGMTQRERSVWSGYPTQAKTRLEWGTEAFLPEQSQSGDVGNALILSVHPSGIGLELLPLRRESSDISHIAPQKRGEIWGTRLGGRKSFALLGFSANRKAHSATQRCGTTQAVPFRPTTAIVHTQTLKPRFLSAMCVDS